MNLLAHLIDYQIDDWVILNRRLLGRIYYASHFSPTVKFGVEYQSCRIFPVDGGGLVLVKQIPFEEIGCLLGELEPISAQLLAQKIRHGQLNRI